MKTRIAIAVVAGVALLIATTAVDARARGGGGGGGSHGSAGGGRPGGFHGGRPGGFHGAPGRSFHHSGFRHGRAFVGTRVFIGGGWGPYWGPYPWWYPPYYPPYYSPYYAAPVAPVVVEPPTYIEQSPVQSAPPSYWYYCEGARAYYPYVQQCPGGWLTVVPQAPPSEAPR